MNKDQNYSYVHHLCLTKKKQKNKKQTKKNPETKTQQGETTNPFGTD